MVGDESWMVMKTQDGQEAVQIRDYATALKLEDGMLSWARRECRNVLESRVSSLHTLRTASSGRRAQHVECAAGLVGRIGKEADASSIQGPVSVTPLLGSAAPTTKLLRYREISRALDVGCSLPFQQPQPP